MNGEAETDWLVKVVVARGRGGCFETVVAARGAFRFEILC